MQRSVYLVAGAGGIIAGVFLASLVVWAPLMWLCCCAGALLVAFRHPHTMLVGACLLGGALGVWRTEQILARPSLVYDLAASKPSVVLTGYVASDGERTQTGLRFVFQVLEVRLGDRVLRGSGRVLVSTMEWVKPRRGQAYVLTGKIQQAKAFDDFDYASYLAKDGIHAIMYYPQYDVPEVRALPSTLRFRLQGIELLSAARASVIDAVAHAVPQPEAGFLTGTLVGAKGVVTDEVKDAFSRTGASHILALSGYNITIVASVLMLLLAPLGRRRSYIFAVMGILIFTVLVGGGASVVRAAIMGILLLTAQQLGRTAAAGGLMAFSAAAMSLWNPLLVRWDTGFQLSFLAFAGIVYGEPLLAPLLQRWVRSKILTSMLATTIAAQIAVLPLLLYTFGQFAVYTLPANVLVLPLVPVAMALGFATALCGIVWPLLGLLVGQVAWLVAAYQLRVIFFFSALPYASLAVSITAPLMFALHATLVTVTILVYKSKRLEVAHGCVG